MKRSRFSVGTMCGRAALASLALSFAFGNTAAQAAGQVVFSDTFPGNSLDLVNKWTYQTPPQYHGNPGTFSVANNTLTITNPGGSCGVCGVTDGGMFIPKLAAPLTGDFTFDVDMTEISRTPFPGNNSLNGIGLLVVSDISAPFSTPLAGISFGGDQYPNKFGQYNNHGFEFAAYFSDHTLAQDDLVNVSQGVLYAVTMRVMRQGGMCSAAFKLAGGNWTSPGWTVACGNAPAYPLFVTFSGDGHPSFQNAAYVADIHSVTVTAIVPDNDPPVLTLPANITAEATSAAGASVSFVATALDAIAGAVPVTYSVAPGSTFPLGTTTVQVGAVDPSGNQASGSFTVTVVDTTPPAIASAQASPSSIWPPNNKMVPVTISVSASDAVGPVTTSITGVTIQDAGTPSVANDVQITGPLTLKLRATRAGNGNGRTYAVTLQATDGAGNVKTAVVNVVVPHDQH